MAFYPYFKAHLRISDGPSDGFYLCQNRKPSEKTDFRGPLLTQKIPASCKSKQGFFFAYLFCAAFFSAISSWRSFQSFSALGAQASA